MAQEITQELAVLLTSTNYFLLLCTTLAHKNAWDCLRRQDNPWGMLKYSYKRRMRIGVLTTYSIAGMQRISSTEPGVEPWFYYPPVWCFPLLLKWSLKRSRNSRFFKRQEPCLPVGQKDVFIKNSTLPSYLNYPVNMRQIQTPCGHILKHQIHRVKSLTGRVNSRARNANPRNRLLGA